MPKHAAEHSATARRRTVTALGMAGSLASASLFLGAGSGQAATTMVTSCGGTASGAMGDSVKMRSDAVQDIVVDAVSGGFDFPLVPITKSNKTRMTELFEADKFDPISLTTVPKAASGVLSDEKITAAVIKKIDSVDDGKKILDDGENRKSVTEALEANCKDLTVKATDYVAPTSPSPAAPPSSGSDTGTGTGKSPSGLSADTSRSVPGTSISESALAKYYGTGTTRVPRTDYGGLPFTLPGGMGRYQAPAADAGQLTDVGVLGDAQPQDAEVSNAGNAEAIAAGNPQSEAIQLPMLLAVVSLAGVAAALVRTWVLRRI